MRGLVLSLPSTPLSVAVCRGEPLTACLPDPCCPGNWAVPAQASERRGQLLVAHHPWPCPRSRRPWRHRTGLRHAVHSHGRWAQVLSGGSGHLGPGLPSWGSPLPHNCSQSHLHSTDEAPTCAQGQACPLGLQLMGPGFKFPSTQQTGSLCINELRGCRCDPLGLGAAGVAWPGSWPSPQQPCHLGDLPLPRALGTPLGYTEL